MTSLLLKALRIWRKLKSFAIEKCLEGYDLILLQSNIAPTAHSSKSSKPLIVYAGFAPNFRVLKQIKILVESQKFELALLHHRSARMVANQIHPSCSLISFRNKFHLKRILSVANQELLIAYSSQPEFAAIAIGNTQSKTLFDPYDCLVVYYGLHPHLNWMKKEIPHEHFCFAKSNGIIARNLEVKESLRRYNLPSKSNILFSDYCDNSNFTFATKSIAKGAEISLVYAGGLYGKSARSSSHGIENFDALIESLPSNRIELHLYPNPDAPIDYYYDYILEQKNNPFLKVHQTIPQKEMGKELSKYHFGVLPHFKEENAKISDAKLAFGTSNKFFNFLEAGLPILVSNEMIYMAWLVKRYQIGIVFSEKEQHNLRSIIEQCNYSVLQQNVLKVREKLSMQHNQQRFIKFVQQFLNSSNWES